MCVMFIQNVCTGVKYGNCYFFNNFLFSDGYEKQKLQEMISKISHLCSQQQWK
jgi:hypothetical protein